MKCTLAHSFPFHLKLQNQQHREEREIERKTRFLYPPLAKRLPLIPICREMMTEMRCIIIIIIISFHINTGSKAPRMDPRFLLCHRRRLQSPRRTEESEETGDKSNFYYTQPDRVDIVILASTVFSVSEPQKVQSINSPVPLHKSFRGLTSINQLAHNFPQADQCE